MWRRFALPLSLLLAVPLSACTAGSSGSPTVVASFYPLQYVAERIVGSHATVKDLTAPGVEPHDLELSPRQVADVSEAKVVFYERGLQPSVDQAVSQSGQKHAVDAASTVSLRPGDGGTDPHFWQDPTLLAQAAKAFADEMSSVDPTHRAAYEENLASLDADLATLDSDIKAGLTTCRTRTIVVSHDAFEYYGRRYGLDVQPIAGLSPDAEPSAAHLAQLATLAKEKGVDTIFSETLASPRLADTLAQNVGIKTAVLDPLEGLKKGSGQTYLTVMRANLAAIQKAGGCS